MDAGEVKAKITITYDGSGIDKAKEDLKSLGEMAGAFGSGGGGGGAGSALSDFGKQLDATVAQLAHVADVGSLAGKAFTELASPIGAGQTAISGFRSALAEIQSPLADMPKLLQAAQSPFLALAEHAGTTVEQIGALSDSFAQLGSGSQVRAIEEVGSGMQQIQGAVEETVPMLPQYADSLHDVVQTATAGHESFSQWAADTQTFTDAIYGQGTFAKQWGTAVNDLASSFNNANSGFGAFSTTAQDAFTAWSNAAQPVKNMQELMGPSAFGPIQPAEGGFAGIMDAMKSGMMGFMEFGGMLFTAQMAGQAIGGLGQAIYNAAAIAEGPGAHGFGTFTGEVDALGQSGQKSFGTFSESLGRQVMPVLQDFNAVTGIGGGTGGLMATLGSAAGTMLQYVAGGPLLPMITGIQQMFGWNAPAFGPSGAGAGIPGGPGGAFFGAPAPAGTTGWQGTGYINQTTGAWVLNPAQAGQSVPTYAPNSFMEGPPGWVPNAPGQGPQPGIMGPSARWVQTGTGAAPQFQTGSFTMGDPSLAAQAVASQGIDISHMNTEGFGLTSLPSMNLSGITSGISSMLSSALGGLGSISIGGVNLSGITSGISSMISSALSGLGSISIGGINLSGITSGISSMISSALSGLGSISIGGINLSGITSGISSMISSALGGLGNISIGGVNLSGLTSSIGSMVSGALNSLGNISIGGGINLGGLASSIGSAINSALAALTNIAFPGIPHFAGGVQGFSGGLALIGEQGPELLSLPAGSSVYPMSTGAGIAASSLTGVGGGTGGSSEIHLHNHIYLDSKELLSSGLGQQIAQSIRLNNGFRAA